LILVCVLGAVRVSGAMPTITVEPYKEDANGVTSDLSTDPENPTLFTWGEDETIRWWAFSSSADNGIPASSWHVESSDGGVSDHPAGWCSNGAVRFCCRPQNELEPDDLKFWVTATDDEGTDRSETYYIRMTFPPVIETDYHPSATEFRGKLARRGRTAFDFGGIPNGIADTPEVNGCDNPSMFYGNGRLHFIFGDPNVYTEDPSTTNRGLDGALAFTDDIVPERGIDLEHHRNWVMDPETGTAKSIVENSPGTSRANNTSGAILPHGDGHRIWFAVYDYGSGPRPSYRNYYKVAIVYSDDYLATPAVREESLVLWEKDDPANGPKNPDPYLGYHMRLFKDHLYMMIPREGGSDPVLLRCHLEDLDYASLDHWRYLVSVDDEGRAAWSSEGITKGQISQEDFPTVDFSGDPAGIVTSSTWNPYLNRWIAFPALGGRVWEARQLWGPYRDLTIPQFFSFTHFAQYYALFAHELLLGNNGEWMYHAQARSWQPLSYYGTYNQRLKLRDKLKLTVSPKTGVAGDTLSITAVNDSGRPAPSPEAVSVTVDGEPASFVSQDGDRFEFSYTLTGSENGGEVGLIDVAAAMDVSYDDDTVLRSSRDVAFVVNRRNELSATILGPQAGATVSGWVPLEVSAEYEQGAETLRPRDPEVRILKTELRYGGAEGEVIDTAVEPPYILHLDSRRFPDGAQPFTVVAYDTLDRRGVDEISLEVHNGTQPAVTGNLIADGNMEAEGTDGWEPLYDAALSKIAGATHRTGERSLRIDSDAPGSWAGFRRTVVGLEGGERLRLTGWARLLSNYTGRVRWVVRDASGGTLTSQDASSYGYFRRVIHEFENPAGNSELMIDCLIRDTGEEGLVAGVGVDHVAAIVDDVVLRPSCHPLVEPPEDVVAEPNPGGGSATISWTPSEDVNVEFYAIYRRPAGAQPGDSQEIGEVRAYESTYTDVEPPGPPDQFDYDVRSVDYMGSTSADVEALGEISDVLAGEPPLLITGKDDTSLVVEQDPAAAAYNVHADELGSWYSPSTAEGSVCGITDWTDNGDGTVTLPYEVPEGSWVVVTASDACREGPAGSASDGTPRTATGTWPACGPVP
jgi:hypothetical protein